VMPSGEIVTLGSPGDGAGGLPLMARAPVSVGLIRGFRDNSGGWTFYRKLGLNYTAGIPIRGLNIKVHGQFA